MVLVAGPTVRVQARKARDPRGRLARVFGFGKRQVQWLASL